jgi:hypothetical protein
MERYEKYGYFYRKIKTQHVTGKKSENSSHQALKWNKCNFEIFSNIKLIVLKNTLRYPLYGTTGEKILSCSVRPQKNRKIGDGDR